MPRRLHPGRLAPAVAIFLVAIVFHVFFPVPVEHPGKRPPAPSPYALEATPGPGLTDRFAACTVLAAEEQPRGGPLVERLRLVELPGDPYNARVRDVLYVDEDGERTLLRQDVVVPNRLLVARPEDPALQAALEAYADKAGLALSEPAHRGATTVALSWPEDDRLEAVEEELAALSPLLVAGLRAEPEPLYFVHETVPNDPEAQGQQWHFTNLQAPLGWSLATDAGEVIVGVVDTGMDLDHPDLAAHLWSNPAEANGTPGVDDDGNGLIDDVHGWDFYDNDSDATDTFGHGTHVSGCFGMVTDNATGGAGIPWNVKILPLRTGANTSLNGLAVLNAIDYLRDMRVYNGANIVVSNHSYGGTTPSDFYFNAIERHRDADMLFVTSAGNDTNDNDLTAYYPAGYALDNIVTVAATDEADSLADFSNYGVTSVDLAAPGVDIWSTLSNGNYGRRSGTSMAAPIVAGVAALLSGANDQLSYADLRNILLDTTDPVPDLTGRTVTGGRVNLARALAAALAVPEVRLVTPAGPAVRLPSAGHGLLFEAAVELEGAPAGLGAGSLDWTVEPMGGIGVQGLPDGRLLITFAQEGDFTVRVRYELGAYAVEDTTVVTVGEGDVLTDGLAAWWTFDEGGGVLALDRSGNGADATLGGVDRTGGRIGQAGEWKEAADVASFTSTLAGPLTFSAWVRPDSAGASPFPRIVELPAVVLYDGRTDTANENRDNVKLLSRFTSADGIWAGPSAEVVDGQWRHVVATYDPAGGAPRIYVDGVRRNLHETNTSAGVPADNTGTGYLGSNGSTSRTWDGRIDEVRLYSRELSAAEARALFHEPDLGRAPLVSTARSVDAVVGLPLSLDGTVDEALGGPLLDGPEWSLPGIGALATTQAGNIWSAEVTPALIGETTYLLRAGNAEATGAALLAVRVPYSWENWTRQEFEEGGIFPVHGEILPEGDADGDGVSNLLEFALAGSPQLSHYRAGGGGDPRPELIFVEVSGQTYAALRYCRPADVVGLTYTVETADLAWDWQDRGETLLHAETLLGDGTMEVVERFVQPTETAPRALLRLKVELDDAEVPGS